MNNCNCRFRTEMATKT